jgi:hypothetical protein
MLGSDDLAQMQADLKAVRDDNPVSITIRRGSTTLAAQTVRIAQRGAGRRNQSGQASESQSNTVVLGETSLDIAVGDRFTVNGVLYQVVFVPVTRLASMTADIEAVE